MGAKTDMLEKTERRLTRIRERIKRLEELTRKGEVTGTPLAAQEFKQLRNDCDQMILAMKVLVAIAEDATILKTDDGHEYMVASQADGLALKEIERLFADGDESDPKDEAGYIESGIAKLKYSPAWPTQPADQEWFKLDPRVTITNGTVTIPIDATITNGATITSKIFRTNLY